jgi:hypothetical protein
MQDTNKNRVRGVFLIAFRVVWVDFQKSILLSVQNVQLEPFQMCQTLSIVSLVHQDSPRLVLDQRVLTIVFVRVEATIMPMHALFVRSERQVVECRVLIVIFVKKINMAIKQGCANAMIAPKIPSQMNLVHHAHAHQVSHQQHHFLEIVIHVLLDRTGILILTKFQDADTVMKTLSTNRWDRLTANHALKTPERPLVLI